MIAMLIGSFFALVAGFAVASILMTQRAHSGAWSALAAEREALIERERRRAVAANGEPARTVGVRRAVRAGPVVYARRFMARSEWTPLRPCQRAAA